MAASRSRHHGWLNYLPTSVHHGDGGDYQSFKLVSSGERQKFVFRLTPIRNYMDDIGSTLIENPTPTMAEKPIKCCEWYNPQRLRAGPETEVGCQQQHWPVHASWQTTTSNHFRQMIYHKMVKPRWFTVLESGKTELLLLCRSKLC